jgi:hypothetical protein
MSSLGPSQHVSLFVPLSYEQSRKPYPLLSTANTPSKAEVFVKNRVVTAIMPTARNMFFGFILLNLFTVSLTKKNIKALLIFCNNLRFLIS